jgi:hypothetical protein
MYDRDLHTRRCMRASLQGGRVPDIRIIYTSRGCKLSRGPTGDILIGALGPQTADGDRTRTAVSVFEGRRSPLATYAHGDTAFAETERPVRVLQCSLG